MPLERSWLPPLWPVCLSESDETWSQLAKWARSLHVPEQHERWMCQQGSPALALPAMSGNEINEPSFDIVINT